MDKDKSLQKGKKMVLLICGDPNTGKKTIVNKWLNNIEFTENDHSFYKDYLFTYNLTIDNNQVSIPIEIRILNSDELESDLKINSSFLKMLLVDLLLIQLIMNNLF
jgi:septin family protein